MTVQRANHRFCKDVQRVHGHIGNGGRVAVALLCLGLCAVSVNADAARRDEELARCQKLHERIERYTKLRRAGGRSAQMERWRRSRKEIEREYRALRCHRYRSSFDRER